MCVYNKKACVYVYLGVVLINILELQLGPPKQKFLAPPLLFSKLRSEYKLLTSNSYLIISVCTSPWLLTSMILLALVLSSSISLTLLCVKLLCIPRSCRCTSFITKCLLAKLYKSLLDIRNLLAHLVFNYIFLLLFYVFDTYLVIFDEENVWFLFCAHKVYLLS